MNQPGTRRYTMRELVRVTHSLGFDFSPDGRRLVHISMRDGRYNLWAVPSSGGSPERLTAFREEAVREARWSSASGRVLFSTSGGDGKARLHLLDPDGNPAIRRLESDRASACDLHWAPDGESAFFVAESKAGPDATDVVEYGIEAAASRTLATFHGEISLFPPSPDGRLLPVLEILAYARPEGVLHLLDRETGEARVFGDRETPSQHIPCGWSPDARTLYLSSNASSEHVRIEKIDVTSGRRDVVAEPPSDVISATCARDGGSIAYVANERGRRHLVLRDIRTSSERLLAEGACEPLLFSPDGGRLLLCTQSAREADQFWVHEIGTGARARLFGTLPDGIDPADLVEPVLTEFPGKGGKISAAFYRPKGKGPFPCVMEIHGGPFSQAVPRYFWLHQHLLQAGIAVFELNYRGSSGHGKTHARALRGNWGEPDLEDVEAAAMHLRQDPEIDPARIALHGTSYGGYLSLLAYGRLPGLWRAVAVGCGPANLATHFNALPSPWRRSVERDWGSLQDPAVRRRLEERSPLTHIDRAQAPLFLWQGGKDPIVSPQEAEQVVEALRKRNVPVEYLLFPEVGHGFTKVEDRTRASEAVSGFLARHLA